MLARSAHPRWVRLGLPTLQCTTEQVSRGAQQGHFGFFPDSRALAVIERAGPDQASPQKIGEGLHGERGLRIDLQTGQEVRRLGFRQQAPYRVPSLSPPPIPLGTLDQGSMSAGVMLPDRGRPGSELRELVLHGRWTPRLRRPWRKPGLPVAFEVAEDEGPINTDGGAEMLQSPTQNGAIGGFIFKGRHQLPGTGHQCVRMSQLPAHQIVVGADGICMRMS